MKKIVLFLISIFISFSLFAGITIYTPTVRTPADGASYQPPNVLLDWDPVAGAIDLYYEILVDTVAGFTNPLVLTTTMSSIQASELLFDTKYYWKVRAIDQTGSSNWSPVRSFNTVDIVKLYRPKKGDDEIFPNVTLIWDNKKEIKGITYWNIDLDVANTFDSPGYVQFLVPFRDTIPTFQMNELFFGQEYFWRVRALHSKDTTEWSETWNFTTLVTLGLKRPKDAAVDQMPDQQMIWDKVDGALAYLYQLDMDPDFALAKTYETVSDRANADKLHFGETYYWRVMAYHDLDSTEWSEVFSFSTIGSVQRVAPSEGETGVSIFPDFKWKSITGIGSYCLEIDDSPDFNSHLIHKSLTPVTTNELTYLLPGPALDSATTYYWRVCALHEYDSTDWGPAWSFKVAATGLEDQPADNTLQIYPNPGNGQYHLTVASGTAGTSHITVMDLVGQQVLDLNWDMQAGINKKIIDIKNLPVGIYMLRLQKDDSVVTRKLIIQR